VRYASPSLFNFRHVIYNGHPLWGFGNRYLGLLSAIVFGVATNRAIISKLLPKLSFANGFVVGDDMMNSVIEWPFDAGLGSHDLKDLTKEEYSLQNDACFREKLPISLGNDLSSKDLNELYPVILSNDQF
jgi:hypothetical protein